MKDLIRLEILSRLLIVVHSPQQSSINTCLRLRVLAALRWGLLGAETAEEGAALDDWAVDARWGDLLLGGFQLLKSCLQAELAAMAVGRARGGAARGG